VGEFVSSVVICCLSALIPLNGCVVDIMSYGLRPLLGWLRWFIASVSVVFSTGSDVACWRYLDCLPALTAFGSDPFPATVICAVRIGSLIGRRSLPTIAYCGGLVIKVTI